MPSQPMNNQKNNPSADGRRETERRMLPFAVEFVKFCIIFSIIIMVALLALRFCTVVL